MSSAPSLHEALGFQLVQVEGELLRILGILGEQTGLPESEVLRRAAVEYFAAGQPCQVMDALPRPCDEG